MARFIESRGKDVSKYSTFSLNKKEINFAFVQRLFNIVSVYKVKGKAVLLLAWSGPEGSRKLRFPDYMTTAQDVGKNVSLTYRPPLPSGNAPGTHFC
jgi:hypothetical protein